ncbi:MAG TPA: PIN domain-containing protein [Anaerolineae bacterium]|nr:PIN domain-containing protein [Anaerolineae bacterium]
MMTKGKVFVDTVAWLALLNRQDRWHVAAQDVLRDLQREERQMVTSEFVLLEVADALAAPVWRQQTVSFLTGLRRTPLLEIVGGTAELWQRGWRLYGERLDKGWGLTDCSSFVIMEQEEIGIAFTADRHFQQAGFEVLLL